VLLSLPRCPNIRILVLNNSKVSWQDALLVGECMPSLAELYLCGNDITSLEASPDAGKAAQVAFPCLQHLDLTDNALRGWASVQPLAQLKQLTELKLSHNRLCEASINGTLPLPLALLSHHAMSSSTSMW
jgi:Leucine-rich repeat (LRR) protein